MERLMGEYKYAQGLQSSRVVLVAACHRTRSTARVRRKPDDEAATRRDRVARGLPDERTVPLPIRFAHRTPDLDGTSGDPGREGVQIRASTLSRTSFEHELHSDLLPSLVRK